MFIIAVVLIYMEIKSESLCKSECNRQGALGSYIQKSGNWKIDDLCICFFENKIKSFKLGT